MFGLNFGGDTSRNVTGIESSNHIPIVEGGFASCYDPTGGTPAPEVHAKDPGLLK